MAAELAALPMVFIFREAELLHDLHRLTTIDVFGVLCLSFIIITSANSQFLPVISKVIDSKYDLPNKGYHVSDF